MMEMLPEIFEILMLLCFGFSWPFAIVKTWRAKRVDGKSPLFSIIVITGYLFGIASHAIGDKSMVIYVYLLDIILVSTDLALYFCFYFKNKIADRNIST